MDFIFNIESNEEFQQALKEVISNYYSARQVTQTVQDLTIIKAAKDDLKKLILDSNFEVDKIPNLLVDKGWNKEKIAFFINLLNEKKTELLYASLIHQNNEYGDTVTGFDWLLKLVLGTSELNTLRYPLLQLILSTENDKQMYDVNKDMLGKAIAVLETLDEM